MKTLKPLPFILMFLLILLPACAPAMKSPSQAPAVIAQQPAAPSAPENSHPRPAATLAPAAPAPFIPLPTQALAPTTYPGGNTFQGSGVNPETKARFDHLSTFALDVDTASYSVARRYIRDGSLPPADAVRVEEFVNSFDGGYAAPRDAAFTIYADGAPSPFDPERRAALLRFGVQGYTVSDEERKPAHLTFVIDTSGSMSMENRLGLVKKSLHLLVDRLDERDWVSIVAFGSSAYQVLEPTNGGNKYYINNAIDSLRSSGTTAAEAGLRIGYQRALDMFDPNASNRVILASDGVANTGETDPDTILQIAGDYVAQGITLTTVGVGMGNFNDALLERLADKGNGQYHYVDTLEEARVVFVDQMISTIQVIARDAKVQVDFNTDVVARYRLLGYENRAVADQDFRNDAVDAGEIGAGLSATALYSVDLKPGAQGRIATVSLRWKDPDTNEAREINGNVNTWDLARSFEQTAPRYRLAVVAAQFAEVLRQSPYAYGVSLSDLARRASLLSEELPSDEQVAELAQLLHQAEYLE